MLVSAAIGVGALIFGNAYASSGHVEAEGEAEHGAVHQESMNGSDEHASAQADEEKEEAAGSAAVKIAWAIVLAIAGTALVPLSPLKRRRPEVVDARGNERASRAPSVPFAFLASLAALSIGAAVIHCVVVSEHWKEHWSYGAFFCASAIAQFAWAIWILVAPSRQILLLGAVGNAAIVAMWVVSRTVGVPLGPEAGEREAVAFADVVATAFEVVLVVGAVFAARRESVKRPALLAVPALAWLAQIAVVALTAASLVTLVQL